jgi:hypothetical protein
MTNLLLSSSTTTLSSKSSSTYSETNLIYPPSPQKVITGTNEQRKQNLRKNVIVLIVAIALLLDGMLNMVILPLVPEFLNYLQNSESTNKLMSYFHLKNGTNSSLITNDPSNLF